jgi:ribA/ribD-fused uncharacterized protein
MSNFHPSPIVIGSRRYATVEHWFQSMKTLDAAQSEGIRRAATPGLAKKLGRRCTMRAAWDSVKDEVMLVGLRAKFTQIPDLQRQLMETRNAVLIEGNQWHDQYWGSCICRRKDCTPPGRNMLGVLLMQVRQEIKDGTL